MQESIGGEVKTRINQKVEKQRPNPAAHQTPQAGEKNTPQHVAF